MKRNLKEKNLRVASLKIPQNYFEYLFNMSHGDFDVIRHDMNNRFAALLVFIKIAQSRLESFEQESLAPHSSLNTNEELSRIRLHIEKAGNNAVRIVHLIDILFPNNRRDLLQILVSK